MNVFFQSVKLLSNRLTWCIINSKHSQHPCNRHYFVGSSVCSLNDVSAIAISAAKVMHVSGSIFPVVVSGTLMNEDDLFEDYATWPAIYQELPHT